MKASMRRSFQVAGLLLGGFTVGSAGAAPGVTAAQGFGIGTLTSPVAMCGYSCRSGGRYIPGPPGVCADEGLNYCGSSRDAGPPRRYYDDRGGDDRRYYERRQERYERY